MNSKIKFQLKTSAEYSLKTLIFSTVLLLSIFMIVATVFQLFGYSNDYIGYQKIFTFKYGKNRAITDPFFIFLRYLNDILFSSDLRFIYLFSAIFSFYFKYKAIYSIQRKYCYLIFVCYIAAFYWIQEYTQIRASCAIAIFLYSINDLIHNKKKNYLIKALIATMFHYSSILMLLFYIYVYAFKSKTAYIIIPVSGLIFAITCSSIMGTELRALIYIIEQKLDLNKSGNVSDFISPLNTKYLLLLSAFLINAVMTKKRDQRNLILMKAVSFGLCFFYWLNPAELPVISVRLAEFFTSSFILYFFCNIQSFSRYNRKLVFWFDLIIVALYASASIRTGIL